MHIVKQDFPLKVYITHKSQMRLSGLIISFIRPFLDLDRRKRVDLACSINRSHLLFDKRYYS